MALDDEKRENAQLPQAKRRRDHANPAKHVLESYGVNFPSSSTVSSPLFGSNSPQCPTSSKCFDLIDRCQPKTVEEEEAQLELVLKASACQKSVTTTTDIGGSGNKKRSIESQNICTVKPVANVENTTAQSQTEGYSTEDTTATNENTAAMALVTLFNTSGPYT